MTKTNHRFNLYTISESRNVIFGIATLWIGMFHSWYLTMQYYTENQFLIKSFKFVRGAGNIGVDMFLFLSGVGLFFSFSKDSNVLSFWKKRLLRVLPSAMLIAMVYYSLRYVHGRVKLGLSHYLSQLSFTVFLTKGERTFWFITLILLLYIAFPVFYKIIEKFRIYGMLGLIVLIVAFAFLVRAKSPVYYQYWEIALCRVPGFVIGIWAGKFVKEKKEISVYWLWLILAASMAMAVLLYYYVPIIRHFVPTYDKSIERMWIWSYRYLGTLLGICLVILDSYVISTLRRHNQCTTLHNFFEFVGMYSLEYYMIYLNINAYLQRVYKISNNYKIMMYLGSCVISLVLCVMVRKVCDIFMAYVRRAPKGTVAQEDAEKWFGFLIYVGLFVLAGLNLYLGAIYVYGGHKLVGFAYAAIGLFALLTRVLLAKRMSIGAILLYLLIVIDPAVFLAHKLRGGMLDTILDGGKKAMLFCLLIVGATAVTVVCNVIYFNKRKALFTKQ